MINIEYANAYKEVVEILRYIPREDYNKIPKNKITLFEKNANENYNFKYNPNISLNEQNVSKRAKAIIAILFRDYWATSEQREKIIAKQNYDRKKLEIEKVKKYNPNDIFKNNIVNNQNNANEEVSLIKVDNKKWYQKIFSFFNKYFFD